MTSTHEHLAIGSDEQVDAGNVGFERGRSSERHLALSFAEHDGPRSCATRDVRAPRVGCAFHGSRYLARDDEHPQISAAGGRDRALNVVDGPLELQRAEHSVGHVAILDANDPVAHRAEQRLDDDVFPQPLERLHGALVALADDRRRSPNAGAGKHRPCPRLVDRALERTRTVDDAHTERVEHMQRVHAEDHLLERTAGKAADEQQIQLVQHHALWAEHVSITLLVDFGVHSRSGDRDHVVAASDERGEQPARVPGARRPEHSDMQAPGHCSNERSSTSGASMPPWWTRPDSVLVSVTAAGLNSSGSMS